MTDGAGVFAAGARSQRLTQGDVIVVLAGTPHRFPEMPEPLSYLLVKVFY